MSILVKIGVVGAVGFAATTGASAQTIAAAMDQTDFLAISEAPLEMSELSDARGGFKFGGFDFNFAVKIAPVVIAPIGDPLPNGVFGENGAPPKGKGGVFGPGGVFGQSGPPPSSKAEVFGAGNNSGQAAELVEQVSESLVVDVPAQQLELASKIVYTPSAPEVSSTAQAASAVSSTEIVQVVAEAPQALEGGASAHPAAKAAPTYRLSGADMAQMETYFSKAAPKKEEDQKVASSMTGVLNTFYSNTLNNVQLRRVIDIDVVVSNFDARINRAIGDTVMATVASTYGLLSRF